MGFRDEPSWPSLPTTGFLSGRTATMLDVDEGRAIFVQAEEGEPIGAPLDIIIPQYAFWKNEHGEKIPVIVVQAEEAPKMDIFGFRDFAGQSYVCTGPEIELLGTIPPP